jgi:hypothetical protein
MPYALCRIVPHLPEKGYISRGLVLPGKSLDIDQVEKYLGKIMDF